jgi:hypothetical protein
MNSIYELLSERFTEYDRLHTPSDADHLMELHPPLRETEHDADGRTLHALKHFAAFIPMDNGTLSGLPP